MDVSIDGGRCEVRQGEANAPTLTIEAPADVWLKIARGEIDRPKALMEGLYKVRGDFKVLARMSQLFGRRK
ncbi:MAG: SCP2 sterol-binding domain-containing protein [Deltaproteobacteria bacterium]|nr:SCP2 sterol-binding domain-containing protein [Deltaproteobacteria bacterium]